jgi:hypothetical protein
MKTFLLLMNIFIISSCAYKEEDRNSYKKRNYGDKKIKIDNLVFHSIESELKDTFFEDGFWHFNKDSILFVDKDTTFIFPIAINWLNDSIAVYNPQLIINKKNYFIPYVGLVESVDFSEKDTTLNMLFYFHRFITKENFKNSSSVSRIKISYKKGIIEYERIRKVESEISYW